MANFNYAQLQEFSLAGSGAIIGATTITLKSMLDIDGNAITMAGAFGNIGFGTLSPGNGNLEEQISFTGLTNNANGTVTLTGVSSVTFLDPYTATSGLLKTHAGSTPFIISNTSGFYNKFPAKDNDETITGQWTFDVTPVTPPAVSDASTTVKGVSKLSVAPLSASNPIAVGTNDDRVLVGYGVDSVGTDAYAITPTPAIASYTAGQVFTFKAGTANTGAATLNVSGLGAKILKKAGASSIGGDATTQFDITLTGGTTYRYTYDGTGTNPTITATTIPTGSKLVINGQNFTAANNGTFTVTGSGANYFEVTNASGVAESNKTLGTGSINNTISDLGTGDISLNQIVMAEYDGAYMQIISNTDINPIVNVYSTIATSKGAGDTQFSVTNTSGSVYRYTWNGVGTDPLISAGTVPIGSAIAINNQNFSAGNNGAFVTVGVGSNYFEVINTSGVVESAKILGAFPTYYFMLGVVWTKPNGLKYIITEVVGAGGAGGGANAGSSGEHSGAGGGAGGYSRKLISASSLKLQEPIIVGIGGTGGSDANGVSGTVSILGTYTSATGGVGGARRDTGTPGAGGVGIGGDINLSGGGGGACTTNGATGEGGSSILGGGGVPVPQNSGGAGGNYGGGGAGGNTTASGGGASSGGAGAGGVVIITEYYY